MFATLAAEVFDLGQGAAHEWHSSSLDDGLMPVAPLPRFEIVDDDGNTQGALSMDGTLPAARTASTANTDISAKCVTKQM